MEVLRFLDIWKVMIYNELNTNGRKYCFMEYIANAGQTYMPFQENIRVPIPEYTPLPLPTPPLPDLILNRKAREKGWILGKQHQHFLPGVTPEMLDWFWANMEKGYYLWAPGSHKRFSWVREPWKYGFENSAHMISESVGENMPVFGGNGVQINRLGMDWFPFTWALEHVICEGIFNDKGEFVDATIHMWQAAEGGSIHIDASVANPDLSEPPRFILEMLQENPAAVPVPPSETDHSDFEASRWPVFLPGLYNLWKEHPDPAQSVPCDLRVRKTGPEQWGYIADNGPIHLK